MNMIDDTIFRLNIFLKQTLSGFNELESIDAGYENIESVLQSPNTYNLGHIGGDIDAWTKADRVILAFDKGCHFVFAPIGKMKNGLIFKDGIWS